MAQQGKVRRTVDGFSLVHLYPHIDDADALGRWCPNDTVVVAVAAAVESGTLPAGATNSTAPGAAS